MNTRPFGTLLGKTQLLLLCAAVSAARADESAGFPDRREFQGMESPAGWYGDLAPFAVEGADAPQQRDRRGRPGNSKVYREVVDAHWFDDNNKFWYRINLPGDKKEFVLVDAVKGVRQPAFDGTRLAKVLSDRAGKTVEVGKWPFQSIVFSADSKSIELREGETEWRCDLSSYELTELKSEKKQESDPAQENSGGRRRRRTPPPAPEVKSPDGRWIALVYGHNLGVKEVKSGEVKMLTSYAFPEDSFARDLERQRSVEMEYDLEDGEMPVPEVYWAPDSRHLVAMQTRAGTRRRVYLVESSPKDQIQPKLESYPYLKPGDAVPVQTPHLFDMEVRREIPLSTTLYSNPWSISDVRWTTNSSSFSFLYNQRGHQAMRIVSVSTATGEARALVDEESKTFVDYAGKYFCEYVDDGNEIVWMSERDGWNHLFLYDGDKGVVKNQITKGEWVVRGVEKVDAKKRQIWFRLSGIKLGQDPYYVHLARINFDGSGFRVLTEGEGTHSVRFSPDYRFFVDTWSRVDNPPVNELRSADDGHLILALEKADAAELYGSGWHPPEQFVAKGRDGVTDIYGVIWKPRKLDPNAKYPIIENIYAGPHDSFAPKSFRSTYSQAELADKGFVVVQMDGMGTSNRSKKFHDVCWKNIADAGFPDRILWIKAAAAAHPFMDAQRVGIYGGSAGGQNALGGLLLHPDFYKAGVADCGCHDNRMDKIWWNELWMGWPVGPEYGEQSNVTLAQRLQGKLLLFVGELDHNVDPSSTLQVVNALIKADKDFEMLVIPGADHGAGGSPYGRRRMYDFFRRALIPPSTGG